jgi:hypothetical protein
VDVRFTASKKSPKKSSSSNNNSNNNNCHTLSPSTTHTSTMYPGSVSATSPDTARRYARRTWPELKLPAPRSATMPDGVVATAVQSGGTCKFTKRHNRSCVLKTRQLRTSTGRKFAHCCPGQAMAVPSTLNRPPF